MDKVGLGELGPSVPQAQADEAARCVRGSRPTDGLALVYSDGVTADSQAEG